MSWKIAIVVAFVTALLMGLLTAPVADFVTRKMKVSNMEGGRGYLVMFLILAGLVGGFVIGVIATALTHATMWNQFWKAEGVALLIGTVTVGSIAGLCLLNVPRAPLMNGHPLAVQVEITLPLELAPKKTSSERNLYLSLYAGPKDNRYVDIDTAHTGREGDVFIVRAQAALNTVSIGRMLSLTVDDTVGYTLDMPLQPHPRKEDLEWTKPLPMRLSQVEGTAYTYTPVMVRYRVVVRKEEQD